MENKKTEFIKSKYENSKMIKLQILLSPVIIGMPVIISILFMIEWYVHGFCTGSSDFDIELFIALIILFGNIMFDVPFVKSLVSIIRERRETWDI